MPTSRYFPRNRLGSLAISITVILSVLAGIPGAVEAEVLTLREGLDVVASRDYDVRVALAEQEAARWSESAAAAPSRPRVSIYADQTWLENRPEAIFAGGTSPLGEDRFLRYGLTVRQTLTDFGRTRAGLEAAASGLRAQTTLTGLTRNGKALEFIVSYASLLQAQRSLELADQVNRRYESHLADAQALYDAGEVTLNDVLAAQVALAEARLGQILARDDLQLTTHRLCFLTLIPYGESLEGIDFPSPLTGIPGEGEVSDAAEAGRAEISILDEQITGAEARLRQSEAGRYPGLYLGAGYAYEENPYRVHEENWSATVGLTWDLYTGGARRAAEGKAAQELTALIARREKAGRMAVVEALDARRLLTGSTERVEVAARAVEHAKENLRLQRARYNEGEGTAGDVTEAITALARAERNHQSAVYDTRKAEARLLFAMGTDLVEAYGGSGETHTEDRVTGDTP